MKKLIFVFFLLITHYSLFITSCFPQTQYHYYWGTIPSPVQANLNVISRISNYLYIVGDNGTLLKSTDGGWLFSSVPGLLNCNLNDIRFNDLGRFTVVGNNGTIYYFTDINTPAFTLESSGTTEHLYSVSGNKSSMNPPIFKRVAVGTGGTIIKSTWNLGTNWSSWVSIPSGTNQDLYSIDFYSPYSGVCIPVGCIAGNNGVLLRTTNFGDNWSTINTGITNKLNCIRFLDTSNCWITGTNGLIMKSTNGGINWATLTSGTTADLKSINIESPGNNIYVCGSNGMILLSTNYGSSWTISPAFTQNNLNSITFPLIVGNSGTILRRAYDSSYIFKRLEGNNIKSYFFNTGIFDQDKRNGNLAGFEWPRDSNKKAIFSAGLSIAGLYQGQLREAMASYVGEFRPGFCINGIAYTNDTFKLYSVKRGDGPATNTDWLNWGLMVPYGAPFVDVNNNGMYEPQVDTPGVKGASQTVFLCYTDGFPESHTYGEGFGGGTAPLFAEVHLTAWCYSQPSYTNMQFLEFELINKGTQPWMQTQYSIICDPDLGSANDDYIGCDTVRKLGFCYNGTNIDQIYGTAPPAVGMVFLKFPVIRATNDTLGLTSFGFFTNTGSNPPPCESDPNGESYPAYLMMQGYKKDSSLFLNPGTGSPPYTPTKFVYTGDPETNIGWTENKGSIQNCYRQLTGPYVCPNPGGDRRFIMSSGRNDFVMNPGDTQAIVICQLIARGSSNLNSVTKLKQLADVARQFYNSGFTIGINKISTEVPAKFRLEQNYPNPFNPVTKIKFEVPLSKGGLRGVVILKVFDLLGREVAILVNEQLKPGTYEVTFDGSSLSSGVYFYKLTAGDFSETKKMLMIK